MTKSELRKISLDRQKSLSDAERNQKSLRIADAFFVNFDLTKIKILHIFLPIEKHKEIKTSLIYERLWKDFSHITTAVSRVDFQQMTIEHQRFDSETQLVENRWHILEPMGSEAVAVERIDAVLVPLLCFDESGFRVGYGKGFYDKFLSECRADCLKIGLSFFAPTAKISDAQDFDVKLNFCVTPTTIYKFAK